MDGGNDRDFIYSHFVFASWTSTQDFPSNSGELSTEQKLYHYTNKKGAKAIKASGKIKKSMLGHQDAAYGEGVYLTSLGPENSTEKLVGNNWDDLMAPPALVKQMKARTKWVVEVPQGKAVRVGRNRDVYLHEGDLYLDGNCKIYRRSNPDKYWSCVLL